MMWIRRGREKEKGFTLVELIVVMAILGILAALAVPRFGDVLSDTRKKANEANIAMIQKAAELYITMEEIEVFEGKKITINELVNHGYLTTDNESDFKGPNGETYTIEVIKKGSQLVVEVTSNK